MASDLERILYFRPEDFVQANFFGLLDEPAPAGLKERRGGMEILPGLYLWRVADIAEDGRRIRLAREKRSISLRPELSQAAIVEEVEQLIADGKPTYLLIERVTPYSWDEPTRKYPRNKREAERGISAFVFWVGRGLPRVSDIREYQNGHLSNAEVLSIKPGPAGSKTLIFTIREGDEERQIEGIAEYKKFYFINQARRASAWKREAL